jgi:ATP-dependent Clp endopeptidase proteolytic subunit ClpP
MMTRKWYSMDESEDSSKIDITIYDTIGNDPFFGGVSAKSFIEELKDAADKDIDLRINSPGGQVFEGIAIYNALARHPKMVNVSIDGMALSIASVIAMSGDSIHMAENAMMMIHNPWTVAQGDAAMFRKEADVLDKVREGMITSYQGKSKLDREELVAMMDEETWFTATEAHDAGLVDTIEEPIQMAAHFDLSRYGYRNVPDFNAIYTRKQLIAELEIEEFCST